MPYDTVKSLPIPKPHAKGLACTHNPPEGSPCPKPATHTVHMPLRSGGIVRILPYCHAHAQAAALQDDHAVIYPGAEDARVEQRGKNRDV